jgi:ankyrin repeat protein
VQHGADINADGGKYVNALHRAVCEGKDDIVQYLVERGANVNVKGNKYSNALQAAICVKAMNILFVI